MQLVKINYNILFRVRLRPWQVRSRPYTKQSKVVLKLGIVACVHMSKFVVSLYYTPLNTTSHTLNVVSRHGTKERSPILKC